LLGSRKGRCETVLDPAITRALMQRRLTGVIAGIRSEGEAAEMLGGVDWILTQEETTVIRDALIDLGL
jgi:hypothetical protein